MAIKFFIASCEKKVSKHPIKDGKVFVIPVRAETQADAKETVKAQVESMDPAFEDQSETYSDWFKNPSLQKVTEEEFNAAELAFNAEMSGNDELVEDQMEISHYPELEEDGFFNSNHPDSVQSEFIFQNNGDVFQGIKVFVLNVGKHQWSYGFKYRSDEFEKHEKMNLDRITPTREEAIEAGVTRLEMFLDYQDEFGSDDSQQAFLSAAMNHDFYYGFKSHVDKIMDAIRDHADVEDAISRHPDFLEEVESHIAGFWPHDKDPEQAIEHINAMQTIAVLHDFEACTECFKIYLPMYISPKTQESMERIEEAIDQPAANDSVFEPKCWKAALTVTDKFYVVIAIQDCGDEGWRHAFAGFSDNERVFGDENAFTGDLVVSRKEAIKVAAQAITDALYTFDNSLSLAKVFMKSPYLQDFEENCIEINACDDSEAHEQDPIEKAIRERLARRPTATMTDSEVKVALEHVMPHITDETNVESLIEAISNLDKCAPLFDAQGAEHLVAGYTIASKDKTEVVNNEPKQQESLPEQQKSLPKEPENEPKAGKGEPKEPAQKSTNTEPVANSDIDDSYSDVAQDIVEQEPANDPVAIPEVELDEKNQNMKVWNAAFKTDLNYTKQNGDRLSINAQYRQMKATEIFGARGKGWGVDVKREWIEDGMPIFVNGAYIGVNESVHNIEVELWYIHPDTNERCSVTAYGETERWYWSYNYSRLVKNNDVRKKSLTDATGKALSMLGICGDVYMGEYDDEQIINRSEMAKMADSMVKKLEFDAQATQIAMDKAKSFTDKFKTAPSLAEIKRLQKLAGAALEAIPTPDKESQAKKEKALSRVAEQAELAINDFKSDIKEQEQANG